MFLFAMNSVYIFNDIYGMLCYLCETNSYRNQQFTAFEKEGLNIKLRYRYPLKGTWLTPERWSRESDRWGFHWVLRPQVPPTR